MVTRTLQQACVDIVHFSIVLIAVFIAYIFTGMFLFGEELEDFAHIDRAANSCWRLLLGDFDWDSFRKVGRMEASIYFVSFSILVMQIMMNMLLAVIMDV